VTKYGRHPIAAAEIRRGKKIETRKKPQGKNIMFASVTQGACNDNRFMAITQINLC